MFGPSLWLALGRLPLQWSPPGISFGGLWTKKLENLMPADLEWKEKAIDRMWQDY